jgi:hypothetical protein
MSMFILKGLVKLPIYLRFCFMRFLLCNVQWFLSYWRTSVNCRTTKCTARVCISFISFPLHCTPRIQRMPVSLSRRQTWTQRTKLRQYVSACIMYRHVTASDRLRDVIVTLCQTVGWVRDNGSWVSRLSFLLHIALRVVSLECTSATSSNEPCRTWRCWGRWQLYGR